MALPQLCMNSPVPGVIELLTTLKVELSEAGLEMEWEAAPPAAFQKLGQFTVLIGNELILCEGSLSGSKKVKILERGAEGSTKVIHAAGSKIYAPFTKAVLDNLYVSQWKRPVTVATAAALPTCTQSGSGATGTLEANANGALTVDGVAMAVGNRVLVKNQATSKNNGIYEVIQAGGAAEKWKLTRTADANTGVSLENMTVFAHSGTTNEKKPWTCTNTGAITIDSTSLTWIEAGDVNLAGTQTIPGNKTFTGFLASAQGISGGTGETPEGEAKRFTAVRGWLVDAERQLFLRTGEDAPTVAEYTPWLPELLRPIQLLRPTENTVFNGLEMPAGGNTLGEVVILVNESSTKKITLANEVGPAGKQFFFPGKANIVIEPFGAVQLLRTGLGWVAIGKV